MTFEYFDRAAFAHNAAYGHKGDERGDFVVLPGIKKIRDQIERDFEYPVTIRVLYGPAGYGKTATLSWLWQQFEDDKEHKTLVIWHSGWSMRTTPTQSFVRGFFAGIEANSKVLDALLQVTAASQQARTAQAYLAEDETRWVLTGDSGGALPRIDGFPKYIITDDQHLVKLLSGTLELIEATGYERLLLLADEAEAPFLNAGKKPLLMFAEFLRKLHDNQHQLQAKLRLQVVLAGTNIVWKSWNAGVDTDQTTAKITEAFKRRLGEALELPTPTKEQIQRIIDKRLDKYSKPPKSLPFQQEAIDEAWNLSEKNIGRMLQILQMAVGKALADAADEVQLDHVKRALKAGT